MFAGHIKVPGGPHVAHGPGVAQAWVIVTFRDLENVFVIAVKCCNREVTF